MRTLNIGMNTTYVWDKTYAHIHTQRECWMKKTERFYTSLGLFYHHKQLLLCRERECMQLWHNTTDNTHLNITFHSRRIGKMNCTKGLNHTASPEREILLVCLFFSNVKWQSSDSPVTKSKHWYMTRYVIPLCKTSRFVLSCAKIAA